MGALSTQLGPFGRPRRFVFHMQDEDGHSVVTESSSSLQQAQAKPLSEAQLRKALGSTLGQDTPFALEECNVQGAAIHTFPNPLRSVPTKVRFGMR